MTDSQPRIARVQPLTTTRALRGPFDYRLRGDQREVAVGSVLRIDFARRRTLGVVTGLGDRSELPAERLAEPLGVLENSLPADLVELAGWMAHEYCSTPARALGLLLAPGTGAGVRPRRVLVAALTAAGAAALTGGEPLNERQRNLLQALQKRGPAEASTLGTAALRRLERRGLVTIAPAHAPRRPTHLPVGAATQHTPPLTAAQARALEDVVGRLDAGEASELLLHGVTGSGKTEVYLQAVQRTLAAGRGAIVLVPEIALTPQTVARFTARFGDIVAVLHSSLSQGERHDEWQRLRAGRARVCVGPRSAVFAPLADIGLIVVDEEHESSYKHEGDPRYDARAVARRRAERHGALLLAGSATPRPEAIAWFPRLRLPDRVDGRPLPPVEVLDMRGTHHPLHPLARLALGDVRRQGGKAIILLNRRGWSNFLSCRSCGRGWMCPDCDVALVLHRSSGFVACHHCGHREPLPARCPDCGSVALARHGAGTERVESELRDALATPAFPVFRLDADVAARKDALAEVLGAFGAAPAGVLVGTQMVAKGHDFPDVGLGVVLDADSTLRFPDFRAEERTFALITQLAGRAGRGGEGRVLVQTLAPDARSIRFASGHDSEGFLADELGRRRALGYPPYGTLVRVVCSTPDAGGLPALAARLRSAIASAPDLRLEPPHSSLLGPAPLFRLRGRRRLQLVLKSPQRAEAIAAVGAAVDAVAVAASRAGVSVSVDVDPQ